MMATASQNLSRTRQAVFGGLPDVLAEIYRDDVNMAVWRPTLTCKKISAFWLMCLAACWFHVDRIPCRLITTYLGTGTNWLPHQSVNRSKLGAGNGGLSDSESGLYPAGNNIETLLPGDVALLKGELWEGNEGAGMVHRSPSMNPDECRLLLSCDFLSPANP